MNRPSEIAERYGRIISAYMTGWLNVDRSLGKSDAMPDAVDTAYFAEKVQAAIDESAQRENQRE